jgi:P-type E1-E2 ATPase
MSIMVGVGRGAQAGVLIKNAEALERMERVDTLVVDKTGTLTEGRPKVTAIVAATGFEENSILRLAASVELASERISAGTRASSSASESSGSASGSSIGLQANRQADATSNEVLMRAMQHVSAPAR